MKPLAALCSVALFALACAGCGGEEATAREAKSVCMRPPAIDRDDPAKGLVALPGGSFLMGAHPERSEEGPPRMAKVGAFSIQPTEVTNAEFARFVEATGYVTLAERPLDPAAYPTLSGDALNPSSLVFTPPPEGSNVDMGDVSNWWRVVQGANWRHPEGPGSSIEGREYQPVVQVGYADALAYARWAGRDLPTEREWEYAARGGLDGKRFTWGDRPPEPDDANVWQGHFPDRDMGSDGYKARAAPVGCFRPNGLGLYDMAGNVWEWTRPEKDDEEGAPPVIRGGSFLCADNYCLRYRPSARQLGPADSGSSHVGFRTVARR